MLHYTDSDDDVNLEAKASFKKRLCLRKNKSKVRHPGGWCLAALGTGVLGSRISVSQCSGINGTSHFA